MNYTTIASFRICNWPDSIMTVITWITPNTVIAEFSFNRYIYDFFMRAHATRGAIFFSYMWRGALVVVIMLQAYLHSANDDRCTIADHITYTSCLYIGTYMNGRLTGYRVVLSPIYYLICFWMQHYFKRQLVDAVKRHFVDANDEHRPVQLYWMYNQNSNV